jgi:hypothetical protein
LCASDPHTNEHLAANRVGHGIGRLLPRHASGKAIRALVEAHTALTALLDHSAADVEVIALNGLRLAHGEQDATIGTKGLDGEGDHATPPTTSFISTKYSAPGWRRSPNWSASSQASMLLMGCEEVPDTAPEGVTTNQRGSP